MPSASRVVRIERVLDVDEGRRAAVLLRLGDRVQRERRLTAGFRSVDLDDAAARETADAEGEIEGDRAGRDDVERHAFLELAHLHDRALAELPLDLGEGVGRGRAAVRLVLPCSSSFLSVCRRICRFVTLVSAYGGMPRVPGEWHLSFRSADRRTVRR